MTRRKTTQRRTAKKPARSNNGILQEQISQLQSDLDLARRLSDEAADAICTVDLSGKLTYANQAQLRLLKVSRKKLLNSHFRNYLAEDFLGKAYKLFKLAKSGKEVCDELMIVDSRGVKIPVEVHSKPLRKGKKIYAIHTVVHDARKRKEFEELQRETEKMQALNRFVAGAANEIKYPLEAIQRRLQKLVHVYENRDYEYIGFKEFKHIMRTLDHVAQRARYCFDTTTRLIALHKKAGGLGQEKCDANEVIRFSTRLIDQQFAHQNIRIQLRLAQKLPGILISETELSQSLMNLLTNAAQSMPSGGTVTVTSKHEKTKKVVRIAIKDQGVGIKKEHMKHIFEPFFTTKHRGLEKSSGLGLSMVYSMVQSRGGDIRVESNLRHGTTVVLVLPAV